MKFGTRTGVLKLPTERAFRGRSRSGSTESSSTWRASTSKDLLWTAEGRQRLLDLAGETGVEVSLGLPGRPVGADVRRGRRRGAGTGAGDRHLRLRVHAPAGDEGDPGAHRGGGGPGRRHRGGALDRGAARLRPPPPRRAGPSWPWRTWGARRPSPPRPSPACWRRSTPRRCGPTTTWATGRPWATTPSRS